MDSLCRRCQRPRRGRRGAHGYVQDRLHSACRATGNPADVLTQVNEVLTPLKQSNMFVTVAVLSGSRGDEEQR